MKLMKINSILNKTLSLTYISHHLYSLERQSVCIALKFDIQIIYLVTFTKCI